jgi:hypothetical protein
MVTYPFSYGLAVIPSAVEKNVASRINRIPGGNQAIDVQWPMDTLFDLSNFNGENLQRAVRNSIFWGGSKCL